nr:hypothetical protein [Tanacetum cinerariifolium]
MAKGQSKKKKAKKDVFNVNFHFDGIFTSWPLKYAQGLREIKSTQDIAEMIKVGYELGNEIDMYVEHYGYDIMELVKLEVNEEHNYNSIEESDDEYYGSNDYEEIENVDFQTEKDERLVIKSISTHDPFLTKLCSARIMFRGMRYETPYQLKLALENYGVAHGYQLWYIKNDWREVLVYYGRNMEEGRCAGKKGNKDRVMKNKVRSGVQICVKKKVVKKKVLKKKVVKKKPVSDSGEGTSQSPKGRRGGGRGNKVVGSTRGGMAESSSMGLLTSEELDEEAFRECMEEQAREQAKNDAEQERLDKERREEIEWEEKSDYFNPANFRKIHLKRHLLITQMLKFLFQAFILNLPPVRCLVDKGKRVASVVEQDSTPKKKRGRPPSHIDGIWIYHKNHGRSERIAKMKKKKAFEFDKRGTGSTHDKAFDVSE